MKIFEYVRCRPRLIIDVGVGEKDEHYAFAKRWPGVPQVGLEPNPEVVKWLLPRYPGLLLPYAVSDKACTLKLQMFNKYTNNGSTARFVGAYGTKIRNEYDVPAITLDWLDELCSFPDDILLWMDIEGSELKALQGAKNMLSKVRWVNVEVRPKAQADERWGDGCHAAEVYEFLEAQGFKEVAKYNGPHEAGGHWDAVFSRG